MRIPYNTFLTCFDENSTASDEENFDYHFDFEQKRKEF